MNNFVKKTNKNILKLVDCFSVFHTDIKKEMLSQKNKNMLTKELTKESYEKDIYCLLFSVCTLVNTHNNINKIYI